ncbi:hypothetical protein, partial [Mobiluncus mulieris]|uniref:hypothetical protein n=1 Tax=Mobiluncus mulieris TaxID=2052 RepID=UPI0021E1261A
GVSVRARVVAIVVMLVAHFILGLKIACIMIFSPFWLGHASVGRVVTVGVTKPVFYWLHHVLRLFSLLGASSEPASLVV